MHKPKVILKEEFKASERNLIEIKFPLDDLLEMRHLNKLRSLVSDFISIECLDYRRQFCGYDKSGKARFKIEAEYSLRLRGNSEDLRCLLNFFQELYPDYFVGLEGEKKPLYF